MIESNSVFTPEERKQTPSRRIIVEATSTLGVSTFGRRTGKPYIAKIPWANQGMYWLDFSCTNVHNIFISYEAVSMSARRTAVVEVNEFCLSNCVYQ